MPFRHWIAFSTQIRILPSSCRLFSAFFSDEYLENESMKFPCDWFTCVEEFICFVLEDNWKVTAKRDAYSLVELVSFCPTQANAFQFVGFVVFFSRSHSLFLSWVICVYNTFAIPYIHCGACGCNFVHSFVFRRFYRTSTRIIYY